MALNLAKNLYGLMNKVPYGSRFLEAGGANLIGQSIPGAAITTGLTTLATGNPIAGLAVGTGDLLSSSLLARGVGSRALDKFLVKHNLPRVKGRMKREVDFNDPKIRSLKDAYNIPKYYQASGPQNFAMMAGSVGSTLAIEPLFYPQNAVQHQQLAQMKYANQLSPNTAAGTMYQMQGIPMRSA
tara:strand:+ start:1267 stop:1818 length:552 start_codon:yes stop_codon:yes gene_type:complete